MNPQPSRNTRTRLLLFQWAPNARPPPCTWPLCCVISALMQDAGLMSQRELLDLCRTPAAQAVREELAANADRCGSDYFDAITAAHVEDCLLGLAEAGKVQVFAVEQSSYTTQQPRGA